MVRANPQFYGCKRENFNTRPLLYNETGVLQIRIPGVPLATIFVKLLGIG